MKKSFIIYIDSLGILDQLTDEQAGQLFKAIKDYQNGQKLEIDPVIDLVLYPFKQQFDRDQAKYQTKCESLRANASRGGIASASKRKQIAANGSKSKQIERVNDNDSVNDKEKKGRFTPPSLKQVKNYCIEKKLNVLADQFINFYESKGWMVGKNKMKSWKAACRTWSQRNGDAGEEVKHWYDSAPGIVEKGKEHGILESDYEHFQQLKAAVFQKEGLSLP